jgi:hypothetical protein
LPLWLAPVGKNGWSFWLMTHDGESKHPGVKTQIGAKMRPEEAWCGVAIAVMSEKR